MKKLAIVVGHTKSAKGAYSPSLKASEYDWNTDLAEQIAAISNELMEVKLFFRDAAGIKGAYLEGEKWGGDAFIELHFNSSHNPTSTGTGVLYQTLRSKPFAQLLFKELHAVLKLRAWPSGTGGICTPFQASGAQKRGMSSLTASNRPSVLIEPFFGSSPIDSKTAEDNKSEMARAIHKAASSFLGVGV